MYIVHTAGKSAHSRREQSKQASGWVHRGNVIWHTQYLHIEPLNSLENCLKAYIYFSAFQHDVNIMNFSIFMQNLPTTFPHSSRASCMRWSSHFLRCCYWYEYENVGNHFRQNRFNSFQRVHSFFVSSLSFSHLIFKYFASLLQFGYFPI